jgi:hypothetical protein
MTYEVLGGITRQPCVSPNSRAPEAPPRRAQSTADANRRHATSSSLLAGRAHLELELNGSRLAAGAKVEFEQGLGREIQKPARLAPAMPHCADFLASASLLTWTCPRTELPTASYSLPPRRCRDFIFEKSTRIAARRLCTYDPCCPILHHTPSAIKSLQMVRF